MADQDDGDRRRLFRSGGDRDGGASVSTTTTIATTPTTASNNPRRRRVLWRARAVPRRLAVLCLEAHRGHRAPRRHAHVRKGTRARGAESESSEGGGGSNGWSSSCSSSSSSNSRTETGPQLPPTAFRPLAHHLPSPARAPLQHRPFRRGLVSRPGSLVPAQQRQGG